MSQDNQGNGKNSLLLTSAKILVLTAVAVTIFLLARSCNDSRSRLESTQNAKIRERDSLMNEMSKVQDRFVILQAEKESVNQALQKEGAANKQLIAEKAGSARQLKTSQAKVKEQNEKINNLMGKNDSLLAMIDGLRGKMEDLNLRIAGLEKNSDNLNKNISDLNNNVKEKEVRINEVTDSLNTVYKNDSIAKQPRFVLDGELSGGNGMMVVNRPYAKNFIGGTALFGVEFNKKYLFGLGTGIYAFNGGSMIPIFAEFRYTFVERKFSPYVFAKSGAMVVTSDKDMSNVFLNCGLGVTRQFSDNLSGYMGAGLLTHASGTARHDSFINLNLGIKYSKKRGPVR